MAPSALETVQSVWCQGCSSLNLLPVSQAVGGRGGRAPVIAFGIPAKVGGSPEVIDAWRGGARRVLGGFRRRTGKELDRHLGLISVARPPRVMAMSCSTSALLRRRLGTAHGKGLPAADRRRRAVGDRRAARLHHLLHLCACVLALAASRPPKEPRHREIAERAAASAEEVPWHFCSRSAQFRAYALLRFPRFCAQPPPRFKPTSRGRAGRDHRADAGIAFFDVLKKPPDGRAHHPVPARCSVRGAYCAAISSTISRRNAGGAVIDTPYVDGAGTNRGEPAVERSFTPTRFPQAAVGGVLVPAVRRYRADGEVAQKSA